MTRATSDDSTLLALFAAEAHGHLGRIEAAVASLGQGADRSALDTILDALHTLAGAARSVELLEFEWLCRALELAFGAARDAGAAILPRESIAAAIALAPQLIGQPAGRIRNQALALCAQLNALAARPAQASARL
jgi:chemotaxis protein histidine kinase CheA